MRIALAIVIIGALNWGLIGIFNFDLVASVFGGQNALAAKIIYTIVGLSGLAAIGLLFKGNEASETEAEALEEDTAPTFDGIRNVNYNTEFGEELDFKKRRKDQRRNKIDDDDIL